MAQKEGKMMGDSCVPAIHFTQAAAWGQPCYERFLAFRELGEGLILDYAFFHSSLINFLFDNC